VENNHAIILYYYHYLRPFHSFRIIMKQDISKQLDFQRPMGQADFIKPTIVKKPNRFMQAIRTIHIKSVILATVAGLVGGIVFGCFHMHEIHAQQKAQQEQNIANLEMNGVALAINNISQDDFDKLNTYLKANSNDYQRRINIIINAYLQSSQISDDTAKADNVATNLAQALSDYQQTITEQMANFNIVMQSVKNHQPFNVQAGKDLLIIYGNYKNSVMTHDVNLDKTINNYGYPDHKGDMSYFQKNHIYEQIQLHN
jgi:hypothetical protein